MNSHDVQTIYSYLLSLTYSTRCQTIPSEEVSQRGRNVPRWACVFDDDEVSIPKTYPQM